MSIKNNRNLMVEQMKRLRGQLNENKPIGDVHKVTSSIFDGMIKKTMSKLKKDIENTLNSKLKGKVLSGLWDKETGDIIKSPIKNVSVAFENDYDGYLLTMTFNHEDGTITKADSSLGPSIK